MAIIASVGAIGIQGFRAGTVRANQAASAANLRQLAAANLLYAADHQTYCPFGDMLIRWHGGRSSVSQPFDPEKGLLAEYLGHSRRVGMCPEFSRHLTGEPDHGRTVPAATATMPPTSAACPDATFQPNRPANVANPDRTLMFATTAFAKGDGLQEYPSAAPRQSVNPRWETRRSSSAQRAFPLQRQGARRLVRRPCHRGNPAVTAATNFYGGDNQSANIGFCGPSENNGWWNPRN